MHRSLLAACLILPLVCRGEDYITEFHQARALQRKGDLAAAEGMQRSFRLAIEAGNVDYATAAGANVCEILYKHGKVIESGKSAREILDALQPFPPDDAPFGDAMRRSTIFGYLERGLMEEGKLGAAWQANRAGAETMRGKFVAATAGGESITLQDVIAMPPMLRNRGWRLLERESDYLDYAGRTIEARGLLDEAAQHLKARWPRLDANEHFYGFKVLASRAALLDFLGYQAEAIAAQRELLEMPGRGGDQDMMRLNLRLNLLRNVSQWEGPSEELLEQARGIAEQLKGENGRATERLIAKMELDLRESQAARDLLAADAKRHAADGYELEAAYAGRDSLVARAAKGEAGLDPEFRALLVKMRALGSKRGEPNLYAEYGDYLLDQGRAAEAIPMFAEALRLTRSFHWTLHEPSRLLDLFNARLKAGDIEGARAVMAELEAWLKANEAAPAQRRALAWNCLALLRARLGDKDGARKAYAQARLVAKDLPEYQKRYITPEMEKAALAEAQPVPVATAEAPRVRLQPLEVHSTAVPGQAANTRFVAFNPAGGGARGKLVIEGPGAEARGSKVSFAAGQAVRKVELARSLPAGDEATLMVTMAAGEGVTEAKVRVSWDAGKTATPASTWSVRWTAEAKDSVVLDASLLEANPFRSVSLFHEIAVPEDEFEAVPFRLRSPAMALRFEYYDSGSGELLAIDANGNGKFSEAGDLHLHDAYGVAAALLPVKPGRDALGVEVRIFAPSGEPLPIASPDLKLESEIYRDGEWVTEADSILR